MCSGKTTVAKLLMAHHGYVRLSLATPMKLLAECARLGAWEYATKLLEMICPPVDVPLSKLCMTYLNLAAQYELELANPAVKPRAFLQDLGSAFREYAPDIWVDALLDRAFYQEAPVVVDDCRLLNEVRAARAHGWKVVGCVCPEAVRQERVERLYPGLDPERQQHATETALERAEVMYDYTILTGGEVAHQQIETMLTSWLGGAD